MALAEARRARPAPLPPVVEVVLTLNPYETEVLSAVLGVITPGEELSGTALKSIRSALESVGFGLGGPEIDQSRRYAIQDELGL